MAGHSGVVLTRWYRKSEKEMTIIFLPQNDAQNEVSGLDRNLWHTHCGTHSATHSATYRSKREASPWGSLRHWAKYVVKTEDIKDAGPTIWYGLRGPWGCFSEVEERMRDAPRGWDLMVLLWTEMTELFLGIHKPIFGTEGICGIQEVCLYWIVFKIRFHYQL